MDRTDVHVNRPDVPRQDVPRPDMPRPDVDANPRDPGPTGPGRRGTGIVLAVGSVTVAVGLSAVADTEGFGIVSMLGGLGALLFQIALLALLRLQYAERAMTRPGATGSVARIGYLIQAVLLCGAICSTVLDAFWLIHGSVLWAVFDTCWPLSMLGMVVIGVRVAIAGRWQGWLRWQTLFAQSWLLWGVPLAALGTAGLYVGAAQFVLGYGVLGVLLATRGRDVVAPLGNNPAPADRS
ncbi:hypothetical protein GYA93_13180 [Gordonia desulfuricans]|uniref:DUF308 domain-containing protein n=1 Tax=Gordonia desulfuricans TaxID=89051 RepID=A0A7K3LQI2_9ACTN|nr:hypothetical protein [Gordonia desulfuricans]NDK90524.1 hypothetical protein [Gordonia desulfuricans]